MRYIKSRIDIREAAKARLAETTQVLELAQQSLDPIMESYGIKTPEEVVEKIITASERGELKEDDENLKRLISTLTRYERAKSARQEYQFVIDHIADFGKNAETEAKEMNVRYPIEWHYVELSDGEVSFYFEKYEALEDSPHHFAEKAMMKAARGTEVGRLHQLLRRPDKMGMSTVLGR